jgi:hypothetical protein
MYARRYAVRQEEEEAADAEMNTPLAHSADSLTPTFTDNVFGEDLTFTPHGYDCKLQQPGTLCQCPTQRGICAKKIVVRRPMPVGERRNIRLRWGNHAFDDERMPEDTDEVNTVACTRLLFE